MKNMAMYLAMSLWSLSAVADGTVPDCFNRAGYAHGRYAIAINGDHAPRGTLGRVEDEIARGALKKSGGPVMFSKSFLLFADAVRPAGARLTDKELQDAAESQLLQLTKINGVEVRCVAIRRPF